MSSTDPTEEISSNTALALTLLETKSFDELDAMLHELHPVVLSGMLSSLDGEVQAEMLRHVTGLDQISEVVSYTTGPLRQLIISQLDDSRIAAVIRRQEIDDAADIMGELPRRKQVRVLRRLSSDTAKQLTTLLAYDQETAGRIMTTLFISYPGHMTCELVLERLHSHLHGGELDKAVDLAYIYVLDSRGNLEGICSLRELLSADPKQTLNSIATKDIISVRTDDDQEMVAKLISDYDFSAIPVLADDDKKMLGIVTVDDIIDVLQDEFTEDLLKLAGTEDADTVGAKTSVAIKSRLPWLAASWIGGTLGAVLLGTYSNAIEKTVALAFFMPVVFGMGGNVGSQASTITVSGLAKGELIGARIRNRLEKELFVGVVLGSVFGFLLSVAAYYLYYDPKLSVTVGISIMATIACAATLGGMLPIIFEKFGFDPAVASGPLVTTGTDLLSITIYFTVASFFF